MEVFGELPELWLPPSNFAVTPILGYWRDRGEVRIASPDEVHEIHHVAIADLLDPDNRINVRHPSGWTGPGFLIGPERDVILWGFTAGIIARLFSYLGWGEDWDRARVRDLPDHMLQGVPRGTDLADNPRRTPGSRSSAVNVLDWCLLALVGIYALSGYWQGFITGAFATAGLLLGGLLGIWAAPLALGDAAPSLWVSLGALFIVIVSASLGQALLQYAGARIRDRITWQPIRAVDAIGGSALSAVAVLLVAWALGVAVSGTRIGGITPLVRDSAVLAKVDADAPDRLRARCCRPSTTSSARPSSRATSSPSRPSGSSRSSPATSGCSPTPTWSPPQSSVVKVRGTNGCGSGVEGTGFFYAPGRLMTNAHVVAGVTRPEVEVGGSTVVASVVLYDADLDIAVLALPDTGVPHLTLDTEAEPRRQRRGPRLPRGRALRRRGRPHPRRSSGCARPTSTARAPSSARSTRCAR